MFNCWKSDKTVLCTRVMQHLRLLLFTEDSIISPGGLDLSWVFCLSSLRLALASAASVRLNIPRSGFSPFQQVSLVITVEQIFEARLCL